MSLERKYGAFQKVLITLQGPNPKAAAAGPDVMYREKFRRSWRNTWEHRHVAASRFDADALQNPPENG